MPTEVLGCQQFRKEWRKRQRRIIIRGGVEDTRLEAKDTKKIRGQGQGQPFRGQTLSRPRPRTQAQVLSKKKKRSSQKFFRRFPQKNVFQKIFQALHKILTIQKIVLSSSRGQVNFRGLEASRPRTWPSRPRPRTSKCVLEAKDVLEDPTSSHDHICLSWSTPETSLKLYENLFLENIWIFVKICDVFAWRPFFLENTCALWPWSLASSIPVLGLERVCPRKVGLWPWPRVFLCILGLGFEPCILDCTSVC